MKKKIIARLLLTTALLASALTFAACDDPIQNASSSSSLGEEEVLPDVPESPNAPNTPSVPSVPSTPSLPSVPSTPPATSTPPSEPQEPQEPQIQTQQYIRCTGSSVNIRAGAGTGYTVVGSAEKGTMYAIIGKTGDWYKTYYRGKTAYIHASYASVFTLEKASDETVEDVLEEGYKLIGVPYVYGAVRFHDGTGKLLGGFSAQKFDCSSLVQYIFYQGAGELLQVTTRTQVVQGEYVPKSKLRRGDCIYFTNEDRQYKTGVERVGHVAVYLGNDYILHTASDYARIEKMSAKRWNFYIEARRFL